MRRCILPASVHLALVTLLVVGMGARAQAVSPSDAGTEGRAGPVLTWQAAWQAALANDHQMRSAQASARAAQELMPQARAMLLPQLSLSVGAAHNRSITRTIDDAGPPSEGYRRYRSDSTTLSLRQPLLAAAQHATVRQAAAQGAQGEAALMQARQELAGRLAQAYFELLLAEDQIELVRAQTRAHAAQLDAAQKRLVAGAGVRTDIDEARARLDLDAALRLEADQQRALSQRRLWQLVGGDFVAVQRLDIERLRRNPPRAGSLDEWITLADQRSPELQVMRARCDAARAEVDKARARHLPTLDAVAQYGGGLSNDVNRPNVRSRSASVGLQLNVPLYNGGGLDAAVRQAQAELSRSDEDLAAVRMDLGLRLHREHRGVSEGLMRVKALEQAVLSSEQLVQSSRRSYAAGFRTTLDVLDAEQQLALARRDLSQSRYGVLLSLVRLQSLAGAFDDTSVIQLEGWLAASPP